MPPALPPARTKDTNWSRLPTAAPEVTRHPPPARETAAPLHAATNANLEPTPLHRDASRRGPTSQPMSPISAERIAERARRPIPPLLGADPLEPEIYRQIHAGLELPANAPVSVIGIISAIRGEGRSTIALGLATSLAADLGVPITLVDADFEHPTLANLLGAGPSPGLASVLREEHGLSEVVCAPASHLPDLSFIPAGKAGRDSARLLRRLAAEDPFRDPQGLKGLVIMDLPPIVNTSYGATIAALADATVLVVRAGVTPQRLMREALARLEGRPPQGVVLNAFRSAIPGRWW